MGGRERVRNTEREGKRERESDREREKGRGRERDTIREFEFIFKWLQIRQDPSFHLAVNIKNRIIT